MKTWILILVGALAITSIAATTTHADDAKKTYVKSDPAAYQAMQALPGDEAFHMLNMIRFRDKAEYPEGSEFAKKGWTGEEAYAEYTRRSSPSARRAGGQPVYGAAPQLVIIGPSDELWDAVFIMAYPSAKAFNAFLNDPDYQEHAFHRSAAVEDSRLIRMAPIEPGSMQPQ